MPKKPVPEGMKTKGRCAYQDFTPKETLFRRIMPNHYIERTGEVDLSGISMPDVSVNRERHDGRREYVLYPHFLDWGVVDLFVGNIPKCILFNGLRHPIKIAHLPEPRNYHHSEIQCYDWHGLHLECKETFPRQIQLRWRRRLKFIYRVTIEPGKFKSQNAES